MKDIVITAKNIRTELWVLLGCFIVANLVNVGTIIAYSRPFVELFTQIGFTIAFCLILYVVLIIPRLIIWAVLKSIRSKQ